MFLSSYHHEIIRGHYHWQKWCQCKRSRSQVKGQGYRTQFSRFWTVTTVWIHIWRWNNTHSLMWHRRGALLFFKVICRISGSHGTKNRRFDPNWAFPGCNSSLNWPMAIKLYTKWHWTGALFLRSSVKFQGHTGQKNCQFWPELSVSGQ